ncbi:uncharacterized protein LOC144829297 [Lissotriton helveticus]
MNNVIGKAGAGLDERRQCQHGGTFPDVCAGWLRARLYSRASFCSTKRQIATEGAGSQQRINRMQGPCSSPLLFASRISPSSRNLTLGATLPAGKVELRRCVTVEDKVRCLLPEQLAR